MGYKVNFGFNVPTYSANFSQYLKWYHKVAKKITSKKVFNTKYIKYDGESYQIVSIEKRNKNISMWLLDIYDNKDGSVRITPKYEVEILGKIDGRDKDYFRVKRV